MPQKITAIAVLLGSMVFLSANAADVAKKPVAHEIDADVWNVIADTVVARDIARMGTIYVPDAVLVTPKGTSTIKTNLKRWGQEMAESKAKGESDSVAFRFSRRQDDAETAFETGIFRYSIKDKSGAIKSMYFPFEQLFVKKNGKWRIAMERQFAEVTQGEWDKLPPNDMPGK